MSALAFAPTGGGSAASPWRCPAESPPGEDLYAGVVAGQSPLGDGADALAGCADGFRSPPRPKTGRYAGARRGWEWE